MKRHSPTIGREVAEAFRTADGKQRSVRSNRAIVASARALERMRIQRRKLRRELKILDQNIRHERKMLQALAGAHGGDDL